MASNIENQIDFDEPNECQRLEETDGSWTCWFIYCPLVTWGLTGNTCPLSEGGVRVVKALVGMETSGRTREAFRARGVDAYSCDLLESQDGSPYHIRGDVFDVISDDWDIALFHPDCTHLTNSAAWAFNDPDYDRYPGVGYHQKVVAGTKVGSERREARSGAVNQVRRVFTAGKHIKIKAVENPIGALSTAFRKPTQIVQPYMLGDDASKGTCLWMLDDEGNDLPKMPIDPALRFAGRLVEWPRGSGKFVERWGNQTDSGQNRLTQSDNRWQLRADTYPGIANALAEHLIRCFLDQPAQLDMFGAAA